MKDLLSTPDIVQEIKTPEKREKKLIDRLNPQRGHTVFEVNTLTMEIVEAEFEKTDVLFSAIVSGQTISSES